MSIIYCEAHDLQWDSDKKNECPLCELESRSPEAILALAECYADPDEAFVIGDTKSSNERRRVVNLFAIEIVRLSKALNDMTNSRDEWKLTALNNYSSSQDKVVPPGPIFKG